MSPARCAVAARSAGRIGAERRWCAGIDMRLKSVLICAVNLCLFVFSQAGAASPSNGRCAFPSGLRDELSKTYPGTSVVSLADLDDYDRKLFKKDHGSRCPGLVTVDFYGDGKPTWALMLVGSGKPSQRKAELVVARQMGEGWEIRSLDTADGTPVVWRQGPGKYEGMSEPATIRATNQVVVFCGYESWAILYAWTGKEVVKTWISD
jgi:hypothetical protein